MLNKAADFEKAINDLEFENQQYVKQIEIENQKIEALEKDAVELRCEIKLGNESIHRLEDDITMYHRQFTHNTYSVESYRSTLEMLTKHEDALLSKKELMFIRSNMEREERCRSLEHYKAILEDYMERYSNFKHNHVLSERKAASQELEKKLQALLEMKTQLSQQYDKQKDKNELPCPSINAYMLKVAEQYVDCNHQERLLEDLVKKCSALEFSKAQEIQGIKEIQMALQEQKKVQEEKKKMNEAKERAALAEQSKREEEDRHMAAEAAERKSKIAIKTKEDMILMPQHPRPSKQTAEPSPQHQQQQQQRQQRQPFLLQMPSLLHSLSALQTPPQCQSAQTRKLHLQEAPAVASLRPVPSASSSKQLTPSRIPLLQSPMVQSSRPPLLRQVQEIQMARKISSRIQAPQIQAPQQRHHIQQKSRQASAPSLVIQAPTVSSASAPSFSTSYAPSTVQPPQLLHARHQDFMPSVEAISSVSPRKPACTSALQLQLPEPTSAVASGSPLMCPVQATPGRTAKQQQQQQQQQQLVYPNTPESFRSMGSSGGGDDSPFDLDQQLAKMRMLATKSPGAIDWATRPMYDDGDDEGNDDNNKPVNSPTQASSIFNSSTTFLTTPFNLFADNSSAAGGDASSSRNMFDPPQTAEQAADEEMANFDFGGCSNGGQGDSSPFCLNFGGGDSSIVGGGGDGDGNFMAMFGAARDEDQDDENGNSDGDSFSFNFGSTPSEPGQTRFNLF